MLLFLGACGGGSSSSGGGESITSNDGTFTGDVEFTVSAQGQSDTQVLPIGFVIQNNALTSFTLDGQMSAEGSIPLSGNSFTISDSSDMVIEMDGVSCVSPLLTLSGTVVGDTITGSIDGTFNCSFQGDTASFDVSGPFTATRS